MENIMHKVMLIFLVKIVIFFQVGFGMSLYESDGYFADWGNMGGRPNQPTCVDIPKNMALCQNIGYSKMRLPNLLDHDTLSEASLQSASWIPLLNVNCHPDTQLFLCSLFSPVCVDRPIFPCRSLCDKVKVGCEHRMKTHGFPWPEMLRCDKFPIDNDLCITAQSTNSSNEVGPAGVCSPCNQVETYENILDNFCRADFAVKTKIKKIKKNKIICKRSKVLKGTMDKRAQRLIRRPIFTMENLEECGCQTVTKTGRDHFLIMGNKRGDDLIPTFIMEWNSDSAPFRNAVKMFKKLDCSDPKVITDFISDPSLKHNSPSAISRFSTRTRSVNSGNGALGKVHPNVAQRTPPPPLLLIPPPEPQISELQPSIQHENNRRGGNGAHKNKPNRRRNRPSSTLRPSLSASAILT